MRRLTHNTYNTNDRLMLIGVNNDGWWGLNDLIMQSEDVLDCLKAMGEDKYQHVCWFDQSVAHHKKSDEALRANKMNVGYGGAQNKMRDTKMFEGCVGELPATLYRTPQQATAR